MPFLLGRRLLVLAFVVLALFVAPTAASPAGRIVIEGPATGSHLRLSIDGSNVLVAGPMAAAPQGCLFTHGRDAATCPAVGVTAIELNMGPGNDFVEVLNRLPFPLTAHLGSGEDKFIGNGEHDTCYPGGLAAQPLHRRRRQRRLHHRPRQQRLRRRRRQRLLPHQRRQRRLLGRRRATTSATMGPGQDGCHGEAGNDRLYGGPDPDQLYGGGGFDYCDGGPGKGQSRTCEAGPRH